MGAFGDAFKKDPLTRGVKAIGSAIGAGARELGRVGENITEGRYINGTAGQPQAPKNVVLNDSQRSRKTSGPTPGRAGVQQDSSLIVSQENMKRSPAPATPGISSARLNEGGGPGQETVGGQTVRNMMDSEYGPLFQKSKATQYSQYGSDMTPRQPQSGVLRDGTYLPLGGFGTGGMVNVGNLESPQAKAVMSANPAFSGTPTMYPVQQSMGKDIFGDTDALIRRRDELQAGMDAHFAKNPLGNDLMANFNSIASQAGSRHEIKEISDRLGKRDELMATLQGIMMTGQNQMNVQGLQNHGQLQNTQLGGQFQLQNTGLHNQGQLGVQGLAGQQQMDRVRAETEGQRSIHQMDNAAEMARTMVTETGETARHQQTLEAGKKPPEYKDDIAWMGSILKELGNTEISEERRNQLWNEYLGISKRVGNGANWGASIKK